MALMPKRVKHRKSQRGRIKGSATRGNTVVFGDYGIQSLDAGWVKATTIEAGRIAAQQYVRGEGKLYIRIFPDKSVRAPRSKRGRVRVRVSQISGPVVVKPGTILYELLRDRAASESLFRSSASKLPVKVRFVERRKF